MNYLYSWSLSQYLSTGVFNEIKVTRGDLKTILRTPDSDEHGFLIECDLEYLFSIHEKKTIFFHFCRIGKQLK